MTESTEIFECFSLPSDLEFSLSQEVARLVKRDEDKSRELKDKEVSDNLKKRAREPAKPGDIFRFYVPRIGANVELVVICSDGRRAECLISDDAFSECFMPFDAVIYRKALCGPRVISFRVDVDVPVSRLDPSCRVGYLEQFRLKRVQTAYIFYLNSLWGMMPIQLLPESVVQRNKKIEEMAMYLIDYLSTGNT